VAVVAEDHEEEMSVDAGAPSQPGVAGHEVWVGLAARRSSEGRTWRAR
jgi:hypothetical protein